MYVAWPTRVNDNWYPHFVKTGLNLAVFVVHMQAKDDNWNFSLTKFETLGN